MLAAAAATSSLRAPLPEVEVLRPNQRGLSNRDPLPLPLPPAPSRCESSYHLRPYRSGCSISAMMRSTVRSSSARAASGAAASPRISV